LQIIVTDEAALGTARPGRGAAIGLQVGIANEATLPRPPTCHGATQSLLVAIAHKAALTAATTVDRPAKSLPIGISNEAALATARAGIGSTLRLKVRVFDKPTLALLGKGGCQEGDGKQQQGTEFHFHRTS
jgi:hypothetical protein